MNNIKYLLSLFIIICLFFTCSPEGMSSKVKEIAKNRRSGLELLEVEGGTFSMGNPQKEDLCPHDVAIGDFHMGKYEVTQLDWKEVMGTKTPGDLCPSCPVAGINRNQAQEFIQKANARYNMNYRLPTEAEWEYAAKGGAESKGYKYSGSDNLSDVGWYDDNSSSTIQPVGGKKPNELGIYDMSGNVSEWCSDIWGPYPDCKTWDCPNCYLFRGGSMNCYEWLCAPTHRWMANKPAANRDLGFRLAMD